MKLPLLSGKFWQSGAFMLGKLRDIVLGFALLMLLWYAAYVSIDRNVMPSPILVIRALPDLLNHNIFAHLAHSLYRVLMSLGVSMLAGLFIGILAAGKSFGKILDPFIYVMYPIPRIAFLPVIMLVFGFGDASKIIMIAIVVVFPIILVVRDGVRDIPRELYNAITCLGASKLQVFYVITLPWAAASVFSTLRVSLGISFAILFFTETYGTNYGMGFFIMDMWQRINYVMMFAGIVTLGILGFFLFVAIDVVESFVLRWKKL